MDVSASPLVLSALVFFGRMESPPGPPADLWLMAERSLQHAHNQGLKLAHNRLLIIDYSRPSAEQRLWVLNPLNGDVLYRGLVAHGFQSGEDIPEDFSNLAGSLQSSVGFLKTGKIRWGKRGLLIPLRGLEPGINDRAHRRGLVIHGAWYVSRAYHDYFGRLGRSWGCPTVQRSRIDALASVLRPNTLVFIHAGDSTWHEKSALLDDESRLLHARRVQVPLKHPAVWTPWRGPRPRNPPLPYASIR